MDIRVEETELELDGRKFIIHKFDPMFGSYLSFQIFGAMESTTEDKGLDIQNALAKLMGKNFEEYSAMQKRILKYCSEVLPAGRIPVINSEGNIAVMNMTSPMLIALTLKTLMFSLQDFFDQESQGNIQKAL